jgi:hypothetical protein
VAWALAKEGDHKSWHLTGDDSVMPSREHFAGLIDLPTEAVKAKYIVVGAELVSPVLAFNEEAEWFGMRCCFADIS